MAATTTQLRLQPARLMPFLRMTSWLVIIASGITVLINIPVFYQFVYSNVQASAAFQDGIFSAISPEVFAIFRSVIRRSGELLFFSLAILIALRTRSAYALLLAMFCASLGANFGGAFVENADYFDHPLISLILISTVMPGTLGPLLLFVLPDGLFRPGWARWLLPVLAISEPLRVYIYVHGEQNTAFLLSLPLFILSVIGVAAQLHRYRNGNVIFRQQFKWIIFGTSSLLIGMFLMVQAYLYLPESYHILTAGLDELGALMMALALIAAVTRYRLYDIDLFINRSLVYGGVFVGLALAFGLAFFAIESLLTPLMPGQSGTLAALMAIVGTALLFEPLRGRIQRFVDRRFYHLRFGLDQLEPALHKADASKGAYSGHSLGGYQIGEVIGRGGMAEIYMGHRDGRVVAVKVIAEKLLNDPVALKRFERECEITAHFMHPGIVRQISAGQQDGVHYMVLEYIDGQSLAASLKERERYTVADALPIIQQVGEALEVIHGAGYLHRDLTPGNILLRRRAGETEAILVDFGLAKAILSTITTTGSSPVGTIAYMAPEQILEGLEVDPRTDVYSFAIVVYEMLTGRLPFSGQAAQMLFAQLQQPAPDPRDFAPDIPEPIAQALLRALAKDQNERFPDVATFVRALVPVRVFPE